MSKVQFFGGCLGVVIAAVMSFHDKAPPAVAPDLHKLTVIEQSNRVLLAWSGPIEKPMRDELAAALARFKDEKRTLVISLNSPGGSIVHGEEVMAAIRSSAQTHRIDTLIEDGSVCASMCVSIFLLGAERVAGPDAQFMFHEASMSDAATKGTGRDARPVDPALRKTFEKAATDALFDNYGRTPRINGRWLRSIRAQIAGRDVWMSGQRLVNEGSGVVDALMKKGK